MFNLALVITLAGATILVGIYLWFRQRQQLSTSPHVEVVPDTPTDDENNAVLVAREFGGLVYANEVAREWLGLNGGSPDLNYVATRTQPTENFLALFVDQSHAAFQLGNRWVEATSHRIPAGNETRTVVVMREMTATNGASHEDALDLSMAMGIIDEIGEVVNASIGVEQVLQSILTIVGKYMPSDAGEICTWSENDNLLYQRGWVGEASYVLSLAMHGGAYEYGEGITGWVARYQRPLLVTDVRRPDAVKPKLDDNPYLSFIAVPLMIGSRFIGTMELTSTVADHFDSGDLALLHAISKPIAISIYNAELYSAQIRRIDDLASLQEVAQGTNIESDTREVYESLNERIAQLVNAEICGVLLYDIDRDVLSGQPPFHGLPDALVQLYGFSVAEGEPGCTIWDRDYWVSNDLEDEQLLDEIDLRRVVDAAGLRNIAIVMMKVGQDKIGAVQVANKRSEGGFNAQDIQNLRILVAQAAIVVENIRLMQRERRHDTELVGLQEITHAIGALTSEDEVYFYSDINLRIAGLMDIAMCGILLYDEENHRLVSQLPFYGVEDDLVRDYVIDLAPGSVLEQVWDEQDYWYTNKVMADSLVFAADLAETAERIGVEKTLMAELTAGGRKLGVLQASNKLSGEDFTDNDARLLLIFATQVAAIIDNARLLREIQRRADEAESLRRLAELAGNVLTTDEALLPVLSEIAALTDSGRVFINMLDDTGSMVTSPRLVFGTELAQTIFLDRQADGFEDCAAVSHKPLLSNNVAEVTEGRVGYAQLARELNLQRMVIVPMVLGERTLGELGIGNRENSPYVAEDVELLKTIAAQTATTIDRVRLYEATGENLSRRMQELDAISRVSNELTLTLDLDSVLDTIQQEAAQATSADGGTAILLRPRDEWRDSDVPEILRRVGSNDLFDTMAEIEALAVARAADAMLVQNYADHESMTPQPSMAGSAVASAVIYADEVVGVLHLFHARAHHFDERAAAFLSTLCAKAALGYGNFTRYEEQIRRSNSLRQRVDQLNQIFELGQMLQSDVDLDTVLEAIAYSVQSVGYDVVVITAVDEEANLLRRVAQAGLPVDAFEKTKSDVMPLEYLPDLLKDKHRISESYFFPIENILDWAIAGLDALSAAYVGNRSIYAQGRDAWHDGDMLLVPISGAGGELLGLMSLDRPQNNKRPDRNQIEVLEIFAHQAAATIENNRLYLSSVRSAELEARLNEMLETIARSLDIGEIIEAVAHSALRLAPFNQMTVALVDADDRGFEVTNVHVRHDDSLLTTRTRKGSLDHTAMGLTFSRGDAHVYLADNDDAGTELSFEDIADWRQHGERVSLLFPLSAGGTNLGVMHLGSDSYHDFDVNEFQGLFDRVSKLTSVAIQNARLFNRAVNLQSFNESVLESIGQGIVVLDTSGHVLSANQFMRDEYGWDDRAVRRDLFTASPELADILGESLRQVLESGEPQQKIGEATGANETLAVRNFYLYPLVANETIRGAVLLVEDVTERQRLEEDVRARANQLAALTTVSGRITSSLLPEEVISLALDNAERVIQYDVLSLWTRDNDQMVLVGVRGEADHQVGKLALSIVDNMRIDYLMDAQGVMTIDDLPRFLETYPAGMPGDTTGGSWLGVPLVNQSAVDGMITLVKNERNFYTAQSEQAAFAFANQVAVALANARLFVETTARTERLSLLNRVSLSLVQSMDTENIFEIALTEIANALRAEKAHALIYDEESKIGREIIDYPRGNTPPSMHINANKSAIYQYVVSRQYPLVYSTDDAYMPEPLSDAIMAEINERNITDFLVLPLVAVGKVIGAFEFENAKKLGPDQLEIALIIANQTAIAAQNATRLDQLTTRTRELETLLEAAQSTSLMLDLQEVFRSVVQLVIRALNMDDCAIMIWDDLENALEVQIDVNRNGDPDRISPRGTKFDLQQYPARLRALRDREVVVISVDDTAADQAELAELLETGDSARMFVPLVVRDQSIGLIQVEIQNPNRSITEQETRLARALGAQVAIAIENARLSTETAAQMDELFIINDLSQAISSTVDIENMLEIVRDQVPSVTGASELYLALYDEDTQTINFPLAVREGELYDVEPRQLNTDEVSFVIRNRRPLILGGDYFSPDEVRQSLGITNGEGEVRSYLGVPLIAGDSVIGVLAVRDTRQTRVFGLNDQRVLTTVGTQLGAAIQNARLFAKTRQFADELNRVVDERTEELEEERDRLTMLYQITADLALTLDMDRVLSRALQMIASAVKAHDGVIMLIDPMTDRLYSRASLRRVVDPENEDKPSHPAEQLARWLILNEHDVLVDDLHEVEYWDPFTPGAEEWRSAMAVLLETNEDVQGVLVLLSRGPAAFSDPLLDLVIAAANQVAGAINNADLYQLIREQAERLGTLLRTEQEEAEKNSAILESIADGVVLINAEGKLSLFNSAAEQVLGLDRDEAMNRSLRELMDIHGESVGTWAQPVAEWTANPDSLRDEGFRAGRLSIGDKVVSVNVAPVYNVSQYLGTVSVFRDITRDVEVDRLKSEFVANVTHELRTPLTPIKGYADLLLMGAAGQLSDSQRDFSATIKSNADRLAMLVEDLLNISKIDAGGETLHLEPVDLSEIVSLQVSSAQNRHYNKNIDVVVNVPEDLPRVDADRHKASQIISNIIDNAFNYTLADGTITISLQREQEREQNVLLTVKDTGIGIPEEFQDRVWDRFARYDDHAVTLDIAGTGLGLAIVKELVEMHAGQVWFTSVENVGTTFYVSLPIEHPQPESSQGELNVVTGD